MEQIPAAPENAHGIISNVANTYSIISARTNAFSLPHPLSVLTPSTKEIMTIILPMHRMIVKPAYSSWFTLPYLQTIRTGLNFLHQVWAPEKVSVVCEPQFSGGNTFYGFWNVLNRITA